MPSKNIGETITLKPGKVYMIVGEDEDGDIDFEVVDTIDYDDPDANFLPCIVRGMIESALMDPEGTIEDGMKAFQRDGVFEATTAETVETVKEAFDGGTKAFDARLNALTKTEGNA